MYGLDRGPVRKLYNITTPMRDYLIQNSGKKESDRNPKGKHRIEKRDGLGRNVKERRKQRGCHLQFEGVQSKTGSSASVYIQFSICISLVEPNT